MTQEHKILKYTVGTMDSAQKSQDFYNSLMDMLKDFIKLHINGNNISHYKQIPLFKNLLNVNDNINPNIVRANRILDPMLDYAFLELDTETGKLTFKQALNYIGADYNFKNLADLIKFLNTQEVIITTYSNYSDKVTVKTWKNISKFLKGTFATELPYNAASKQPISKRFDYKELNIQTKPAYTSAKTDDLYFSDLLSAQYNTRTSKMNVYTVSTELSIELADEIIRIINNIFFNSEDGFHVLPEDMQTAILHMLIPTYRQILLVDDFEKEPTFFRLNSEEVAILANALLKSVNDKAAGGLTHAISKFEFNLDNDAPIKLAESTVDPQLFGKYIAQKADTSFVIPDEVLASGKTPVAIIDVLKQYNLEPSNQELKITPPELLAKMSKPLVYLYELRNLSVDFVIQEYKFDDKQNASKVLQFFSIRNNTLPVSH